MQLWQVPWRRLRRRGAGWAPGYDRAVTAAAVLYVKDLGRVTAFYERCFGLTQVAAGDGFRVLASEDWELSLVAVPEAVAAAIVVDDPPRRREEGPVKLSFEVASLEDLVRLFAEAGGVLDPLGSAWEFRGRRHLDGHDPEGNVVQVRQPA